MEAGAVPDLAEPGLLLIFLLKHDLVLGRGSHTQEICQPCTGSEDAKCLPCCLLIGGRRPQCPAWSLTEVSRLAEGWSFRLLQPLSDTEGSGSTK